MPTYDYECESCGDIFEVFHGMTEEPDVSCEKCGSTETRKKITSGSGIIFKGSGFYTTDYKKKKAPSQCATSCENKSCPAAAKKED